MSRQFSHSLALPSFLIFCHDGWYFVCEAITPNDETKEIILAHEDFGSGKTMKNALSRHLYEYYGNSNDTTQIQAILVDQNPPVKKGLNKHGIYKINGTWHYVEGDRVISADGKSDAVVALGNKSGQQAISTILDQPDLTKIQRHYIADNMHRFNDSTIAFPVWGSCC